jgi:uncharacterized protein (TIGR02284 family)
MDDTQKIEVLNTLIVINNDRIEGYKTANGETNETDLKMLFSDLTQTSIKCREELIEEVTKLGGTPDEGTRITGKFFRVWMDVKAALTGNDRKTIVDSCEYGEDAILETYTKILDENQSNTTSLPLDLINKQFALLKSDHDKVKQLRDLIEIKK